MRVTGVTREGKRRLRITVDEDYSFVLPEREAIGYDLDRVDQEIPEEVWADLRGRLRLLALERSGRLLQGGDYSVRRLSQKLLGAGIPQDIAQGVVGELLDAHYLDDERMAQTYVRLHLQDRSVSRIRMDLQKKGISAEVADAALAEFEGEQEEAQQDQILRLLRKRHYSADLPYEERSKIMAFLCRRGYGMGQIRRAMEEMDGE